MNYNSPNDLDFTAEKEKKKSSLPMLHTANIMVQINKDGF